MLRGAMEAVFQLHQFCPILVPRRRIDKQKLIKEYSISNKSFGVSVRIKPKAKNERRLELRHPTKVFAKAGLENLTSAMCKHQQWFGLDVQCSTLVLNFNIKSF
jgi:hypothetical protein